MSFLFATIFNNQIKMTSPTFSLLLTRHGRSEETKLRVTSGKFLELIRLLIATDKNRRSQGHRWNLC